MQQVIPVLRMFDIANIKEFYFDWLGYYSAKH
jgi:Glyoxalase superfamily protein